MLGHFGCYLLRRCLKASRGSEWLPSSFGYCGRNVREWWLACNGMLDPCLGSDSMPSSPLQLVAQVRASLGRPCWFPVLHTFHEGIELAKKVPFPPCAAPFGVAVRGGPQSTLRVPLPIRFNTCLGCWPPVACSISWVRKVEWARGPWPLFVPK